MSEIHSEPHITLADKEFIPWYFSFPKESDFFLGNPHPKVGDLICWECYEVKEENGHTEIKARLKVISRA